MAENYNSNKDAGIGLITLILIIGFFIGKSSCKDSTKVETKGDKTEIFNDDTTKVKSKEDKKEDKTIQNITKLNLAEI